METTPSAPNDPEIDPLQKRALLFRFLAVLWIFPSLGAFCIVGRDFPGRFERSSLFRAIASLPLECWVALAVLWLQLTFGYLAFRLHRELNRQNIKEHHD